MSHASIAGDRPLAFDVRNPRGARSDSNDRTATSVAKASSVKRGFLHRMRTIRGVNLRGVEIDITPADIQEDLDYGRD